MEAKDEIVDLPLSQDFLIFQFSITVFMGKSAFMAILIGKSPSFHRLMGIEMLIYL